MIIEQTEPTILQTREERLQEDLHEPDIQVESTEAILTYLRQGAPRAHLFSCSPSPDLTDEDTLLAHALVAQLQATRGQPHSKACRREIYLQAAQSPHVNRIFHAALAEAKSDSTSTPSP